MAFKKTFLLSDETVNSYGFVVKTAGIRLDNAKNNLPAFYDHRTWEIPLGHWENLRVENNKLLGDLIINGDNEREKNYIKKIENGDIKGASIGADAITWSEDPAILVQGQTRPTLTESDLFEASITPLPGNTNALALKHNGSLIALNATNTNDIIPSLKKETDMKAIALKLGLPETATENEILAAIGKVQLKATQSEGLQKLVAESAEGLSEDDKEIFIELSNSNPEKAAKFLKAHKKSVETRNETETTETSVIPASEKPVAIKKDVSIASLVQSGKTNLSKKENADEGKDTYDYLQKHNPVELKRIHAEEPERYAELAKGYANGVRYTGK